MTAADASDMSWSDDNDSWDWHAEVSWDYQDTWEIDVAESWDNAADHESTPAAADHPWMM